MKHDPLEELIRSIPLRSPSADCDQKVMSEINAKTAPMPAPVGNSSIPKASLLPFIVAVAASLLIGFFVGIAARDWNRGSNTAGKTERNTEFTRTGGSFELADNIKILDGQSKTMIVGESIHWQNNIPVRKVETVTHKKVLVRDQNDQSEKEVEIPIRKTFFTLAETI